MEPIIAIVGFLGAGKTTLLKHLLELSINTGWKPSVVLNDYENAHLDAQQLPSEIPPHLISPLRGSCICCSGITELREMVNRIPERDSGITFIEANGTSDACSLMGFLGVGLDARFKPPVQISVVDAKNWQTRGEHNELEASQIQVSSIVVFTHTEGLSTERLASVEGDVKRLNPHASILTVDELELQVLSELKPSSNTPSPLEHNKAHWASCSIDLPELESLRSIEKICTALPDSIQRVKGCTKIGNDEGFTYFERCPDGEVYVRPYRGVPVTGPKLLAVGPGSDPAVLEEAVANSATRDSHSS